MKQRKCSFQTHLNIVSYKIDYFRENIRKLIRARDSYGHVFDDVKKMQAMKHLQDVEAGPNPPPPGTIESETPSSNEGTVVPYTDTSLMQRGPPTSTTAAPNQIANLMRKAPTMPKPKWHPPWKLYRVIAGHLGWVRCVTVEPGNEVCKKIKLYIYSIKKGLHKLNLL